MPGDARSPTDPLRFVCLLAAMDGFAVISLQAVWPSAVFPVAGVLMLGGRIAFQYHMRYSWVHHKVRRFAHLHLTHQSKSAPSAGICGNEAALTATESTDQRQAA